MPSLEQHTTAASSGEFGGPEVVDLDAESGDAVGVVDGVLDESDLTTLRVL
jgi:hypothetical protein